MVIALTHGCRAEPHSGSIQLHALCFSHQIANRRNIATTVAASLLLTAQIHADDVGPDKALELVEQGAIKHFRELNKIAQELHPNSEIIETELANAYGKYVYKVELRESGVMGSGAEWNVDIDA